MTILQIEHKVPNYEGWKKAFDNDPIGRQNAGVKQYRVYRQTNDPDNVIIDLVFDNPDAALRMLQSLRNLWNRVEGTIMISPKTLLLDLVEAKEY